MSMTKLSLYVLLLVNISANVVANRFFVSSNADKNGNGSISEPWLLQTALNQPAELKPGDTVWVRGGVYINSYDSQNSFMCLTNGSENAPIVFRNYNNERAVLDGNQLYTLSFVFGKCSYTTIWGLEVTNTNPSDRDHVSVDRGGNVYCTAENIKLINMIIHDTGEGIDSWKTTKQSEIYGCIIYNIGNNRQNGFNWEGHGLGMYLQNDTVGTKFIDNNIVFNTFGYGIKVWQTTTTAAIGNFDIQWNIVFNSGAPSENLGGSGHDYRTHNFFIVANGEDNPILNTVVKHNYTFSGTNTPRPPVNAFGLNYGVKNFILDSNYLTCQTRLGFNNTPVFDASVKGNKIIAGITPTYGFYLWGFINTDYPDNTYFPTIPANSMDYFVIPN